MIPNFSAVFSGSILDVSKRKNMIFWISQVAIIASTVIGVYLATSEGLKSAVQFHSLTSLEKKYYTLNALNQEISSNNDLMLGYLSGWINKDENGSPVSYNGSASIPDLNWFVWKTMQSSSETLELPVDILRDANRYYLELTELISLLGNSRGSETLMYAISLEKLATKTQVELLERIDTQLDDYKKHLSEFKELGNY